MTTSCLSQWHVHLFVPCCTARSSRIAAMFLQMEDMRKMTDPSRLVPKLRSSIASLHLLLPTFLHFRRGPWVIHMSLSLRSKPSSPGYKWSLLTLPCSTDTACTGIQIHSQPYLVHLYIQNMCSGSYPLHRHLFNSESTPSTKERLKRQVWSFWDVIFSRLIKRLSLHRWLRSNYLQF